jgi:MYXO-CTERM domain-containing protein
VLRFASIAGLLLLLGAAPAPGAAAGAPAPVAPDLFFFDGDRRVDVERLPTPAGEPLTPVRLRYEGRAREGRAFVDHTAIVELEPGAEADLAALGARVVRPLMPSIGLWLVEDTEGGDGIDVARRLRAEPGRGHRILRATPNLYTRRRAFSPDYTPNDPRLPGQWYFANLKMPAAWALSQGDAKTTIVVIDTGCDPLQPDLVDKLDPGLDVVDGDKDPSPHTTENGSGHGTACAGLAAASTNNGIGIAGGCPACRLRCVRLITDQAVPTSADVDAFQFALDTDAAVVTNSWGYVDPTPVPKPLEAAINNVFDHGRGGRGALVLFAMGNDDRVVGDDELENVRGVLGIGAINNFDEQTPFTNSGNAVDLVAPTGTLTTDISGKEGFDPGDYTSLFGGTSSACPVAAGIAGLLVSAAGDRTSAELYDVMIKTARPAPYAVPDAMGHDAIYGYGIIDPVAALHLVLDPPDAGAPDAGDVDAGDAGDPDAGTPTTSEPDAGCSCDAAGAPLGPTGAAVYALGLALVGLRARRRR